MNTTDALLKGILATVGRTAFPPEALYKIVAPTVGSAKQVLAYNLCDGDTPQAGHRQVRPSSIAATSVAAIAKWVEAGVVIRVGAEGHPLHLYPLTT